MRNLKPHILFGFIVMLMMTMLTSCKGSDLENPSEGGNTYIMFNITPVFTRTSNAGLTTEKIKSLRIIIIDTDDPIIECNHYVDFADSDASQALPVQNFQYYYTWATAPGNKKVYLIANEGSVTGVEFQPLSGVSLPANLPATLSGILNDSRFKPDLETGAEDLINIMESLYFSPNYVANADNEIFIPYVSVYDREIVNNPATKNEVINWTTYMVPVATKFTFQFNNFRSMPVYVDNVKVSSINNSNFLFARVGTDDYTKDLKNLDGTTIEEKLYWVDWLAAVSRLSGGYSGYYPNLGFNETLGWISDYELPASSEASPFMFVSSENGEPFEIDEIGTDNITPGTTTFGPFYVAESCNMKSYTVKDDNDNDVVVTQQVYEISFDISEDKPDSKVPSFKDVQINNLRALFRNTNIVIVVNFNEGDVEVFGMIADWTEKFANGWVVKE